jgi:hypothetical protein
VETELPGLPAEVSMVTKTGQKQSEARLLAGKSPEARFLQPQNGKNS